jgi:hypothetical protein
MMLILALICFAALIVAWAWLPASAGTETEPAGADVSLPADHLAEAEAA